MPCAYTNLDRRTGTSQCKNKCQKSVCWQNAGEHQPVTPKHHLRALIAPIRVFRCVFGLQWSFSSASGSCLLSGSSRVLAQSSGLSFKSRQLLLGSTGAVADRKHECAPPGASKEKTCLRCTPLQVIPAGWFSRSIPVKRSLRLSTRCGGEKNRDLRTSGSQVCP